MDIHSLVVSGLTDRLQLPSRADSITKKKNVTPLLIIFKVKDLDKEFSLVIISIIILLVYVSGFACTTFTL